MTLHIVDLWQYYVCYRRSGLTRCTNFVVLYRCRMCQGGLHVVFWSHICIFIRLFATEPRIGELQGFYSVSVSLWNDVGVWWYGTGGFQEYRQCLFIGIAARSLLCHLLFSLYFFPLFPLWVGIVWPGSSDWEGVNRSLQAFHCRPFLIIIIIIIIIIMRFHCPNFIQVFYLLSVHWMSPNWKTILCFQNIICGMNKYYFYYYYYC